MIKAFFLFLISITVWANPVSPTLFFKSSDLYDSFCASAGNPIDPAWTQEAFRREKEFSQAWEYDGTGLMEYLYNRFPKGFSRKELTVTISACPRTPSYSNPLIVNVTPFLRSYMQPQNKPPRALYVFVEIVFHELLHNWVDEHLDPEGPLLVKYKNEALLTKRHMHLFALQRYVYTVAGRADMYKWMEDAALRAGGAYTRAWMIVEQEGVETFLSEFETD